MSCLGIHYIILGTHCDKLQHRPVVIKEIDFVFCTKGVYRGTFFFYVLRGVPAGKGNTVVLWKRIRVKN